ncbi:MAG: dihydrolipoyl dehydrogenase [Gemmatimonadetes bacterium]|nr:dihydrolipoyl dehydrogenase [Gemmatimonadota bacterium]HPF62273.1 dihydrolipoyl dehydrogenase [Gemmatimonadales bacterium]HRX17601.1 dihydrolipoyl dehydrogenase [Gemmatimonadales bacterium]
MAKHSFDVIIIGGGPAGYPAAIRASQLGLRVAVVEKDKLGGVCVNIGCIPTKALLHSAALLKAIRGEAAENGITTGEVAGDYGVAMKRSRKVADQNSKGAEFLMKKNKVTVFKGTGVLTSATTVTVGDDTLTAAKAVVLATGSRTKGIPAIGLAVDGKVVITSDEALFLEQAPARLAIVGAGAVGTEFADIFASFGSTVTLIEALPRVLPIEDAECSDVIAKAYKKRGIAVMAGVKVQKADVTATEVTLHLEVGGKQETVTADKVLMAAGRAVNTEGLGLEKVGVALTDRGFIQVDPATLETSVKGVYAIGDVAGPPMLAHKGTREGVHVAEVIAGHHPRPIDYSNVPSVTYCHPEVASVGLTEEQCKERKLAYQVGRFPFSANGRARASNETDGFVKIIRDTQYGEILGAHVVSGHASEIIHELIMARTNEYTVEEVDLAIHAHPTLSEAIAEAALDSMGRAIHF